MEKLTYTFRPKEKYAKAYGRNLRISRKASVKICNVIRKKTLKRARRLLDNLLDKKQSLQGKYYTGAVAEIKNILQSCEKNAEFLGMNADRLFVHASAHQGNIMRRRRRKSAFGSRMKSTNVEILLVERGKEAKNTASKKDVIVVKNEKEMKKAVADVAKKIAEKKAMKSEEKNHEDKKEAKKSDSKEQKL